MKLLFENWRKYLNEGVFYVSAAQLLPAEELGHGKNDEGYDAEQAVAEKMQQIQQGKLEPIEELKEARLREVYEETGLTLSEPIEGLYTKGNTSFFKTMMPPQDITLSDEHTDYKFVSIDEIPENISGRFIKAIKASL